MYYISTNINDLIDYVEQVNQGENYNGTTTTWANIIKHYNQDLWAVVANHKYIADLQTLNKLEGWTQQTEI